MIYLFRISERQPRIVRPDQVQLSGKRAGNGRRTVKRILLTGMSGVGKSAVLEKLAAEGFLCVDLDDGWMREGQGERLINLEAVRRFVREHEAEPVLFAGCAANQGGLNADYTILLTAFPETMRKRIAGRKNPFGKDGETWQKILADKEETEPLLKAKCDMVINTEQALEDTVRQIRQLLEE